MRRSQFDELWPVWLYDVFPHYFTDGTIFGKQLLNIKPVFWFYLRVLSETFIILRGIQRDAVINVHWSPCKVLVILVRVQYVLTFLDRLSKNTQIPNLIKVRPVGAVLFHADGQTGRRTDATMLIAAFRNFANAPKFPVRTLCLQAENRTRNLRVVKHE